MIGHDSLGTCAAERGPACSSTTRDEEGRDDDESQNVLAGCWYRRRADDGAARTGLSSGYDTLKYERDGHVVVLTYNRPEQRNAVSVEMNRELHHAWQRFRDDVRALQTFAMRRPRPSADTQSAFGPASLPGSVFGLSTTR